MHFIAMLAFEMDMPVTYDTLITLISALITIASCSLGGDCLGPSVFIIGVGLRMFALMITQARRRRAALVI